jgi:predicted membrane-bound spermidine synthase
LSTSRSTGLSTTTANKSALVLGACLFATGLSSLVYQVLWSRFIASLVGASSIAHVIVLIVFMGGLALGSWVFGQKADRVASPGRLYAVLELAIGLYAIALPWLLKAAAVPYLALARGHYPDDLGTVAALRFLLALVVLLPPTVLMGGTLPAAVRMLAGRDGLRHTVARLYFLNSLGASFGASLAAFVLLPSLGMVGASVFSAALNIAAAAVAWVWSNKVGPAMSQVDEKAHDAKEPPFPARTARAALVVIAASGFAGLGLEVAWIRLLAMMLGSTAQAFAVMLSAFILGIALGSAAIARTKATIVEKDPLLLLAYLLCGAALALALTLPLYERAVYLFTHLSSSLTRDDSGFVLYQLVTLGVCIGLMLLPTIALGAAFPVATRATMRGAKSLGTGVGLTYAVNTLGTITGAPVAAILMPTLQLHGLFVFELAVLLLAAAAALWGRGEKLKGPAWATVGVTALALVSTYAFGGFRYQIIAAGVYRSDSKPPDSFEQFVLALEQETPLYVADGFDATVTVGQNRTDVTLRVNGKADASAPGDMSTQALLGHIPMVLKPDAKKVLVVGLGSGVTTGATLQYPDTDVDTVELLPEVVVAAAEFFGKYNEGALDNPRMHLTIDDAKTFLQLSRTRYDVIISEPSNPWMAGIATLFSTDFYEDVDNALAPNGLFVQWCHTYETSDEVLALVARTLMSRFPYIYAFEPGDYDVAFVASKTPLVPDYAAMATRFSPQVKASLQRANAPTDLPGLLARQILSPVSMRTLAGTGALNTDGRPILEFLAPIGFFKRTKARQVGLLDERKSGDGKQLLVAALGDEGRQAVAQTVRRPELAAQLRQRAAGLESDVAAGKEAVSELRKVVKMLSAANSLDSDSLSPAPEYERAISLARRLTQVPGAPTEDSALLAEVLRKAGQHQEAARLYQDTLSKSSVNDPRGQWYVDLAQSLVGQGDLQGASQALAAGAANGAPEVMLAQGRAALGLAQARQGQ